MPKKTLREVEADYEVLRRDEARIPSMEQEKQRALEAAGNATLLEKALDLLNARSARRGIEAGLNEFPEHMDRLRGDELKRLEVLDGKREKFVQELDAQVRAREEATRCLQETGLAEGRPESTDLQTHTRDLEKARRKADQRDQKQEDVEKATSAEEQALAYLGGEQDVPRLEPDSVSRAETLANKLRDAERKQQELRDRLAGAGQVPDQASVDRHFQAVEALRAWLASERGLSRRQRLLILVAVAGGLTATLTAILLQAWFAVLGGGIAIAGGAACPFRVARC